MVPSFVHIHDFNSDVFGVISEGKVMVPTKPIFLFTSSFASRHQLFFKRSSDCECLSAHTKVLAIQDRLGTSYKDVAHCLCMAEIERMKSDEKYKSFGNLKISIEKALGLYFDEVKDIEGSVASEADI
jgi:hypothetical protein